MPIKSIWGAGGLQPEQSAILDNWSYDEQNNRMSTDASIRSGLNSFDLAEMHTTHSGGENVFDQNNISKINWFPVWQGVKPLVNVGDQLGLNPTVRQYKPCFLLQTNGANSTITNVNYTSTITLTSHESVVRLTVKAGEDYIGKLTYVIKDTDVNGITKYRQNVDVTVFEGDAIVFNFTHPSESRSGSTIYVDIMKEDGTSFLVKAGIDVARPWLEIVLSIFDDSEVVGATRFIDDSFTIYYAGDYEVDTNGGAVTITVPNDFTQVFYVSDANQSFSQTNPCTVAFGGAQGNAVLQTSRDSYKFYYDGTQWRYKDLGTKNGGIV